MSGAELEQVQSLAEAGKKIVFVSGNFNVVHPGHLRLLNFAASCGDHLIVALHPDGTPDVFIDEQLRLESIRSIGLIHQAFILRTPVEDVIQKIRPAVVVKGKEHEERENVEKAIVETYGGKLLFSSGDVRFSSLDLLRKEFRETNFTTIVKPADFPRRHGFTMRELKETLAKFNGLRVAVVGDLIIDDYIACDPLGMSQEDPTIVVTPVLQERFVGGAGIVAAHARGLGAEVSFFSVTGKDEVARYSEEKLAEYGVKSFLFEDESRPTTLKQRFRANGKTLLRVSHLRQHDVTKDIYRKMLASLKKVIAETDLLVFSDFNYGALPQPFVDGIHELCRERKVKMVADSQSSSQVGDVSRFKGMMLITPTEREARLAVRDFNSGLVVLAESLRKKSETQNVIITLGQEGLLVHSSGNSKRAWEDDRLPAMNTSPKDSAGAGDSLLTCSAMALTVGADIWQSAYLGSVAAACQVGRIGNIPLKPEEIQAELSI